MKLLISFLSLTVIPIMIIAQSPKSKVNTTNKEIINGITVCWNGATKVQKEVISELLDNMIYVDGGTFIMGSTDPKDSEKSKPAHRVNVKSFWINKYELTKKVWDAITGDDYILRYNTVKNFGGNTNEHVVKNEKFPVLIFSDNTWNDMIEFIVKLNSLTGLNFRLPTEAEWEYAAKGGKYSRGYKYSGSNSLDAVAWHHDNDGKIHAVGEKFPNELGIYDMSGNVSEWTSDKYTWDYSTLPYEDEVMNVSRGGFFQRCSCDVIDRFYGDNDGGYVGVRLVMD